MFPENTDLKISPITETVSHYADCNSNSLLSVIKISPVARCKIWQLRYVIKGTHCLGSVELVFEKHL